MQILPILIAIVLGLLALAFVLYPFYRRVPAKPKAAQEADALVMHNGQEQSAINQDAETTEREREEAARAALREIELDYHLGNIEEADYRNLRERYMRRAITALKARYEKEQHADANEHVE